MGPFHMPCQGGGGGRSYPFSVSFSKGSKFIGYSQDMVWSRSRTFAPEADLFKLEAAVKPIPLATFKEKSLKEAFDAILPVGLRLKNPLVISQMKDEIAYEVLYSKLLHHPTITKIEFSTAKHCKSALANCCCNLVRNSDTLEELHFQDIGALNENMVQTLFESVKISRCLKVLNLRTSRYLETWGKGSSGGGSNKPSIRAESVLAGLQQSMESSPLESLDFGGNAMLSASSASIVELMTILLSPSFGLKRLSFRGCDLAEEGLLAIATELENHDCLEFLDLSHNTITKPVMERLANCLVKNQSLKELKLEHSKIDLEMVECLASSLPQIQRLQHLYLDGNEFTWKPLTEEKEAIGTIAMVRGLEKNKSLLSLEMGECGMLAGYSMTCCTSPPYSTTLKNDNWKQMKVCLKRNKILLGELKWSRSQQAVVKIVEILLGKLADEAE